MRVLSATVGALLISVSYAALAQEQNVPQGETAQVERRCEPRAGDVPQLQSAQMTMEGLVARPEQRLEQSEMRPTEMTAEDPVAQLPERPLIKPTRGMTAEELVAQLPEAPLIKPTGGMTAEELVAQLPEAPLIKPTRGMTAEELVAQLPERPLIKPTGGMTAEELVAQLPEAPLIKPTRGMTAEELVAQLPEAPLIKPTRGMTAEELVAQLPEAPLIKPTRGMTAEELVAQLPEAPLADMQEDEKRQPEAMKAEMQQDQRAQTEMPRDPQWTAVNDPNLGTTVDIPGAVLSTADGRAHKRAGRRYKTPDGRAKVAIWTQRNARHETPASYLHRTFNIPRSTVDYERFTADFAVISGLFGTKVYYIRCNFSSRSGSFHCFDLAYPVREMRAWDDVVNRMSRSLRAYDEPS
jgi:hypothetical protein